MGMISWVCKLEPQPIQGLRKYRHQSTSSQPLLTVLTLKVSWMPFTKPSNQFVSGNRQVKQLFASPFESKVLVENEETGGKVVLKEKAVDISRRASYKVAQKYSLNLALTKKPHYTKSFPKWKELHVMKLSRKISIIHISTKYRVI